MRHATFVIFLAGGFLAFSWAVSMADDVRLVVEPAEIEVDPGSQLVITAVLKRGDRVIEAKPWAFRLQAEAGSAAGNLFTAPDVPGRYRVRVTHRGSGRTRDVYVSVRFPSPVASFTIEPVTAVLGAGERIVFRAIARDAEGEEMPVRPFWSTSAGTIDPSGSFEAPRVAGPFTIRAQGPGRLEARLEGVVALDEVPLENLLVEPSGVEVDPGRRVILSVRNTVDQKDMTVPSWEIEWSCDGGSFHGNIWQAPEEPGEYVLVACRNRARGEARIRVKRIVPPLVSMKIEPETVTLAPGGTVTFKAVGVAADGTQVEIEPVWQVAAGTIDQKGVYRAPRETGHHVVGAGLPDQRLSARAQVRIVQPDARRLVVQPARVAIRPGERIDFEGHGLDGRGEATAIDPVWSATGGDIDGDGHFMAGDSHGSGFQVTLRDRRTGLSLTVPVEIQPHPVWKIEIEPSSSTVRPGEIVRFRAKAIDREGRTVPSRIEYDASSGRFEDEGVFLAPQVPGEYEIVIVDAGSGTRATARVVVLPHPPKSLVVDPSSWKMTSGETKAFEARLIDARGAPVEGRIQWQAEGGSVDPQGRFTAGGIAGVYQVKARHEESGLSGSARVEVVPPDTWLLRVEAESLEIEVGSEVALKPILEKNGKVVETPVQDFTFQAEFPAEISRDGRFQAPDEPGTHEVQVVHRASGASTRVRVVVKPIEPASIVLKPQRVEIKSGERIRFEAKVLDSRGRALTVKPEFRADGGEVDQEGNFTAGDEPGTFEIHAFLRKPLLSARAEVTVAAVSYRVEVIPHKATLAPGETVTLQPSLVADGKRIHAWHWTYRFEAEKGRFDKNVYHAPTKAGTYTIRIRHDHGEATVEVTVRPGQAARVVIEPPEVTLSPGETVRLRAMAFDAHENPISADFLWQATGGEVSEDGTFVAGSESGTTFFARARVSGSTASGRSRISVKAPPTPYRLVAVPARVEVQPGATVAFDVTLYRGDEKVQFWPWELEYQAGAGDFRGGRYFAPSRPGSYEVRIKHRRAEARAVVVVLPPLEVEKIEVVPGDVTLEPGGEQQFHAIAIDEKGQRSTIKVRWSAFGGEIDQEGKYRAPEEMGDYIVAALVPGTQKEARAKITVLMAEAVRLVVEPAESQVVPGGRVEFKVSLLEGNRKRMVWSWDLRFQASAGRFEDSTYVAPREPGTYWIDIIHPRARSRAKVVVPAPEVVTLVIEPAKARLGAGESQAFKGVGRNKEGREIPVDLEWQATGGQIDGKGRFTAGTKAGDFHVKAVLRGSGLSASVPVEIFEETRYLGLGRRWGDQLRSGQRNQNDLINYIIANIFFRSANESADFRKGFIEGHRNQGEDLYRSAWRAVLFEFGRYYGREFRRQAIGVDQAARFMSEHVLPRDRSDLDAFRRGFLAGHAMASASRDYDRILLRARK